MNIGGLLKRGIINSMSARKRIGNRLKSIKGYLSQHVRHV